MMSSSRRGLGRPHLVAAAFVFMALTAAGAAGQQRAATEPAALRSRVEARYDIVPLRAGIGLRPKVARAGVQMIEISDGTIAIDGVSVSGRELRDRIGADADVIIQLSYYDADERRAFLGQTEQRPADIPSEPRPRERSREKAPPPAPAPPPDRPTVTRHRVGERVRVFGSVRVARDESVDGQVVAVLGSAHIDGHVADQVVAVLGSVDLGPDASVEGDVVAVGGRVRRADGAQIGGRITEVTLPPNAEIHWAPWWGPAIALGAFGGAGRLFGTLFRLFLLGVLASVVVLVVPQGVDRIRQRVRTEPMKMGLIGLLAQLLFFPVLILTIVVLAISIVGIPLLLLVPFAIVALLFVLLWGFTGSAYVLGDWAAAQSGRSEDAPYMRVWLGILVVLTPLLAARLFGIVGGPLNFAALMVAAVGLMFEYIVWTIGFGAALTTAFEDWRTRRAPVVPPPPPARADA